MNVRKIILTGVLVCSSFVVKAQNVTASPYSMFGLGEIEMGEYGENAGMGGIGIGYSRRNSLNTANPASLTSLAPNVFVLEGSFSVRSTRYESGSHSNRVFNGNLQRIALGTRISSRWAFGAGLVPFTRVGYAMQGNDFIEGTNLHVNTLFEGSGGLSKLYIANAFQITPKISFGVNSSLIFGSLKQNETQEVWTIERTTHTQKIYFDGGIQYKDSISKNLSFIVGLTGGYQTGLTMHHSLYATDSDGNVAEDTNLVATLSDIPEFYGIGFSLMHKKGFTLGADYRFQRWSRLKTGSSTLFFRDLHRFSAGMSYIPNAYNPDHYYQAIIYQAGFSLSNSYIQMKGKETLNYAVTAGVVLPLKNASTMNIGVEYGKAGSSRQGSIREDYVKFTVGISLEDIWFVRPKFD